MDKPSDLIIPFNKINRTINNNQDLKYAAQGRINRYKEEIQKLDLKMQLLNMDKIKNDIGELEPLVQTMENQYKAIHATLPTTEESLATHHAHLEHLKKNLNQHKERTDKNVDDYFQEYKKYESRLKSNNETYRTLQEKKSELKRSEFNIMKQQHDLKQLKEKKAYSLEIKKKLFYADTISIAENWLAKKNYDELIKKETEVEKKLTELLKEVVETGAKIKNKQSMNLLKRNLQTQQASNNDLEKKLFTLPGAPPPRSALSQKLRTLDTLNERFSQPCEPLKSAHNQNLFANNQLLKLGVPNKIKVLENKVIQTAKKDSDTAELNAKKREEKSKALKAKLEKVVLDFKAKRLSQSDIKSSRSFRESFSSQKAGTPEKRDEAEADTNVLSSSPLDKSTPNSQSGAGALPDNLTFLSQDVSAFKYDSIVRSNEEKSISQRSNINVQPKTNIEEKFGKDPGFPETQDIGPLGTLGKSEMGTPGMIKSQIDKNNTMPNLPFVNNAPKLPENQNFNTNMPFTPRPGISPLATLGKSEMGTSGMIKSQINKNTMPNLPNHQNFNTNMPFTPRPGISPLAALKKSEMGTPGMIKSQIDKNNTMPNLPFVNNSPKLPENLNFNTNMPFIPRPGPSSYNSQLFAYSQNANNSAKRQKLENSQQKANFPSKAGPSSMVAPDNFAQESPDTPQLGENVDNYNFGNVTQFFNNSGDFNTLYGIDPDQPGMEIPYSPPLDYEYGDGQSDGFPFFHFK